MSKTPLIQALIPSFCDDVTVVTMYFQYKYPAKRAYTPMDIQHIVEILKKENITLRLEGDNLRVAFKQPLTAEDIGFIKEHKPALVEHLKNQPVPSVDQYGRRQCQTCDQWTHDRCSHPFYTARTDYGQVTHYQPDPTQWVRCGHHSLQATHEQENNA